MTIAFVLLDTGFQFVLGLPWGVYSTFRLEARHGFNKQTPALFLRDIATQARHPLVIVSTYI